MGIRLRSWLVSSVLVLSCARPPRGYAIAEAPAPPPGPPPAPLRVAKAVGYRLAPSQIARNAFAADEQLDSPTLLGGVRAAVELSGLSLASSVSEPPLQSGARIPEFQGGGFLFWNRSALYRADSFLGALKPIASLPFQPQKVSFAPSFALVHGSSGERVALDLRAKRRVPLQPALAVDVVARDRRALALLENGAVVWSADSGKSYAPVSVPRGEAPQQLEIEGESLLIALESGSRLRMSAPGVFALEPPQPKRPAPGPDPGWPFSESPLERALGYGVPLTAGLAAVAARGAVVTVDLTTGAIVHATRQLAPSDLDCRLLDLSGPGAPFMACSNPSVGAVVFADTLADRPRELLHLPRDTQLDVAGGVLVVGGRCDGVASPTSVCVRGPDGALTSYDVAHVKLDALNGEPPKVTRWIPKQGGGALGVVVSPPGVLDAKSGEYSAFKAEFADAALSALATPQVKSAKSNRARGVSPGSDWLASAEGELRGWQANGALTIARDGRVLPGVLSFRQLVTAGARAFAVDGSSHTFQSVDLGRTWNETLAPPGFDGRYSLAGRCSAAGCQLGPWLRQGWIVEAPLAPSRGVLAEQAALLPAVPVPELSCSELGQPLIAEKVVPSSDEGNPPNGAGFGASEVPLVRGDKTFFRTRFTWNTWNAQGPGESAGLRAFLYGERVELPELASGQPLPANLPALARPRAFSYVAPFDPRATVLKTTTELRALLRAAVLNRESTELEEDDDGEYSTVPVLGRGPAASNGLLALHGGPVIWLQEPAAAQVFALSAELEDATIESAFASDAHTLVLLVTAQDETEQLIELKGGQARRLFALAHGPAPANADALALGPDGKFAVVRTRSGSEPASELDPALLLADGAPIRALPAWSTLGLADAPACAEAADDYRVLLQTTSSWLRLRDAGVASTSDAGSFAILRVNAQRWCLEAVELAHDELARADATVPSRVVARFAGKNKGAARIAIAPGFELRQPLACSIQR